jgi:hypothetical protein
VGNCAPDPHMLRSVINQNHPWWKALAELVDNAFDAGATAITIECDDNTVSVLDNGCGVCDISALLTLGKHVGHKKTRLGIFGIGIKDAWLSCADIMEVVTVNNGTKTNGVFDINQILANNWEYDDPSVVATTEKPYTLLRFRLRKDKKYPNKTELESLAWVFTPALSSGRSITTCRGGRNSVLPPSVLPPMSECVRDTFDVDGRKVSIEIGIVKKGHVVSRGPLWLIFGHRIIDKTNLGCGNYSTMGIAGSITLDEAWKPFLTKNKDGMTADLESVGSAILRRIEPLLKHAQSITEDVESAKLRTELEGMLNASSMLDTGLNGSANVKRKQRRYSAQNATGAVKAVGTARRIVTAAKVHPEVPGAVACADGKQQSFRRTGFKIDYCEIDQSEIGDFLALTGTVRLNLNHPFISAMKTAGNKPALYSAAVALITDHGIRKPDGRPVFAYDYQSFATAFGEMMSAFSTREPVHES